MNEKKAAAIDIGSNAVRLFIAQVRETPLGLQVKKELLLRIPLRLGEDSFMNGSISHQHIRRLVYVMKTFHYLMSFYRVDVYLAYATAALREASNNKEILQTIFDETTVRVSLLTANEEAWILYESHVTDWLQRDKNYLYVDIGGGTTEIIIIENGRLVDSHLFNIGALRKLLGKVTNSEKEEMSAYLSHIKERYAPSAIIGSGGNINKIARLTRVTKNKVLTLRSLYVLYNKLRQISVEGRISLFDLSPDRADVIVPACEILINVARGTAVSKIIVPTIGLVDGIVRIIARKVIEEEATPSLIQESETETVYTKRVCSPEEYDLFDLDWSSDDDDD